MSKRYSLWPICGALLCILVAFSGAHANSCDGENLNTVQRAECWWGRADKASAKVRKNFDLAIAAAHDQQLRFATPDFRPDIRESQRLWKKWMKSQCALQAEITMGSAEPIVGAICAERLSLDRAASLKSVADDLTPPPDEKK